MDEKRSFLQEEKKRDGGDSYPALREGISHSHLIVRVFLSPEALLRSVSAGKSFLLLMLNLKTHKKLHISHLKMLFDNFSMISSRMGIQEDC